MPLFLHRDPRASACLAAVLLALFSATSQAQVTLGNGDVLIYHTDKREMPNARLDYFPESEYPRIEVVPPELGSNIITNKQDAIAVVDWMWVANGKINSLKGDVEILKRKVTELEEAIAALKKSPATPPGTSPATPSARADDARFQALEARIAELEAQRGSVRAPFTVIGAGGKPVMQVRADGVVMFGSGSSLVRLEARPGAPVRFGLQSGTGTIEMTAEAGKGQIEVFDGPGRIARLAASAAETGLTVETNGQDAAGLSALAARPVALRIFGKGGKTIAAMGENPRAAGTGLVYVGNGSANGAALAANADGSGVVHAFATDATVGSALVGKDRLVAAYNASGAAVVSMGKSESSEGGNVTARDPTGEGVFRAGFARNGGGEACVYRQKRQNTFCLGIPFH